MQQSLLNEAIQYFKSNKGFHRVFTKLKEKYQSLGRIGGTLQLSKLTREEQEALTGLLGKDFSKQNSASIKVEHLQGALENTRFEGIALEEIAQGYFGEELLSKKEERLLYEEEKAHFFEKIAKKYVSTQAYEWLYFVLCFKENAYRMLSLRYDENKKALAKELHFVCKAINHLPCWKSKKKRLALFASEITQNPHGFDENTDCGKLFLTVLLYFFPASEAKTAEERAELLYKAGLLKDDLSNYTVCSGLLAYKQTQLHLGWQGFYDQDEALQISLESISRLERVSSPSGKVFIVENPAVFSGIRDAFPQKKIPLVCTYGQLKLASLVLLDLLAKENMQFYYSGDFDPEGLSIADKLKSRYKDNLRLWRYTEEDYVHALSDQEISEARLKQIDRLQDIQLKSLGQRIKQEKKAGYQELLLEKLTEDILLC